MSDLNRLASELEAEVRTKQAIIAGAEHRVGVLLNLERDLKSRCAELQAGIATLEPQYNEMLRGIEGLRAWITQSAGGN